MEREITTKNYFPATIDVHIHFEGAVPSATLFRLASSSGLAKPTIAFNKNNYSDFQEFAQFWDARFDLLNTPDRVFIAAEALALKLKTDHIETVVMHFSPAQYEQFGMKMGTVVESIQAGFKLHNVTCWLIADCVRDNGPENATKITYEAAKLQPAGVVGIGLGGDETILPTSVFKEAFALAQSFDLDTHSHCGEFDIQSVVDAVESLNVRRVVHGHKVAEDKSVMQLLVKRGIAVEVCLSSYECMYGGKDLTTHPLPVLIKNGIEVLLGTDDPDMFRTDISHEYCKAQALIQPLGYDIRKIADASKRCGLRY